jgi:glycosyltransferase involved in cell wall biosynthesis
VTVQASVVIPTRNRPATLKRILGKFVAEIDRHALAESVEIILVDDASNPPVAAYLSDEYRRHACVKTLRLSEHGGCSAARNAGIAHTTGEILILIDDDIVPSDNYIRASISEHQKHPEIVVLNGNLRPLRNDIYSRFWFYYYASVFNRPGELYPVSMLASGNCSIKRSLLTVEDPLFDSSLPTREDFDLYLRVKAHGIPVYKSDRILAFNDCRNSLVGFVMQRLGYAEGQRHLLKKYAAEFLRSENQAAKVPINYRFLHLYVILAVAGRTLALKQALRSKS